MLEQMGQGADGCCFSKVEKLHASKQTKLYLIKAQRESHCRMSEAESALILQSMTWQAARNWHVAHAGYRLSSANW